MTISAGLYSDEPKKESVSSATKPQGKSNISVVLLGIGAAAILLRLGIVLWLPRMVWRDEVDYLLLGRNLLDGRGFTNPDGSAHVIFPPAYPFVVGTIARFVGDLEWASDLAYVLCGSLLLFPVAVIARRIYGTATAAFAVAALAICPALTVSVLYAGSMTEPLYTCLLYGALAALLVGLQDHRRRLIPGAGLLFGLAYLVRPEAFAHAAVSLLVIFGWLMRRGVGMLRQMRWPIGGFVVAFALAAAPYVWYLHIHTGKWLLTGKGQLTWELGETQMQQDWVAYDEVVRRLWGKPESFQGSLVQHALAVPGGSARRVVRNTRHLLHASGLSLYGLFPLLALAFFRKPWDARRAAHMMFLVAALIPFSIYLAFLVELRFFAPALPVLLLWAVVGTRELGDWLCETVATCTGRTIIPTRANLLRWAPAAALLLFLVGLLPLTARDAQATVPLYYKVGGLWLRAHTPIGTKVMTTRQDVMTFYADRVRIPLPHTDWPGVLQEALAQKAGYLIVDEAELRQLWPQLSFLLDSPPPELAFVRAFEGAGQRTRVYQFVDSNTRRKN
jgi:Dolichyl-phosphate-mannose-protein mannosyltransferase